MLRSFDLDPRFGPSKGIERLERWDRAESLGLRPPQLVREMVEKTGWKMSVLDKYLM